MPAYTALLYSTLTGQGRLLWVLDEDDDTWLVEELRDNPDLPATRVRLPKAEWVREPAQLTQALELEKPDADPQF